MKVAVLAGDGIGSEIVAQTVRVLRRLGEDGLRLELESAPVGIVIGPPFIKAGVNP